MPVPSEVGCSGLSCSWDRKQGSGGAALRNPTRLLVGGFQKKVGRTWSGAVISPAVLFSAKPNRGCRGRVVAGQGRCPGAGSIPRLELVPFSSSQTSEMSSVERRRGGREGSHPFPPVEHGRKQRQGKQGQPRAAVVGSTA